MTDFKILADMKKERAKLVRDINRKYRELEKAKAYLEWIDSCLSGSPVDSDVVDVEAGDKSMASIIRGIMDEFGEAVRPKDVAIRLGEMGISTDRRGGLVALANSEMYRMATRGAMPLEKLGNGFYRLKPRKAKQKTAMEILNRNKQPSFLE